MLGDKTDTLTVLWRDKQLQYTCCAARDATPISGRSGRRARFTGRAVRHAGCAIAP
jgi:hypothetical protein